MSLTLINLNLSTNKDKLNANRASASFSSLLIPTHRHCYVAELAFDQFSKLPESLVSASVKFMKFPGHYMKFDDTTCRKHFNWKDFRATISNYQALDLADFLLRSTVISQADTMVSMMAKSIATFLDDALRAGVDLHELETTIEAMFAHLKDKKAKGVANFYQSTEEGTWRSSWECRLCFALPNEYLHNYFCRMVTTIKLEANIEDEESSRQYHKQLLCYCRLSKGLCV
ncbi:delta-endotoxin CytB [Armillaria gallica]|uniref:Delta-endotoxin CytB n=1 Tax=Armillaria gallica TaxID=47427 RepID=A0A2H3CLR6_ARMGA|nr:delta-endotoxin CytB [Armillaria gallica]